jgi:ornithine cyclodeaminase/alanine dehydrogenase-like protein (mu-crystallin family)
MQILFDQELESVLPMAAAIAAVRNFFVAASNGNVVTPPRHTVATNNGGLTFTIGAETEFTKTIGFRVYDTFPHAQGTNSDQIVAVYCNVTGRLKGMVVGGLLGAIRTAAIAGVAMDCLAPADATALVLIGAGHQAYFQVAAALSTRPFKTVTIFNRSPEKAWLLARRIEDAFGVAVTVADEIRACVERADAVLCATSANAPVLAFDWLKPGAFVSSIGPKTLSAHELPTDIQRAGSLLVTDSKMQLSSYGESYFLPDIDSIAALEDVVSGKASLPRSQNTFFLSAGRSGTEVVVADAALQLAAKRADRGSNAQLYASLN